MYHVEEEEMAIHSSILAWKIPWTVEPDGLYGPWGFKELDMTEHARMHYVDSSMLGTIWIPKEHAWSLLLKNWQ